MAWIAEQGTREQRQPRRSNPRANSHAFGTAHRATHAPHGDSLQAFKGSCETELRRSRSHQRANPPQVKLNTTHKSSCRNKRRDSITCLWAAA
eukprot:1433670-Rhodomonas_salina.2